MRIRWVTNHWGWSAQGIRLWIRNGWGFFPRWSIEGGARDGRDLQCCKLGPIAWSWSS